MTPVDGLNRLYMSHAGTARSPGYRKAKMISLQIHDRREQLGGTTQQWLIDHPGCVILPGTMVAAILLATDSHDDESQHGEAPLSREDRAFIQSQATGPAARDAGFRLDSAMENAAQQVSTTQSPATKEVGP
jgi:hypothetical protein